MTEHLAHRGPDARGLWVAEGGRVVLGHRRLSVIDLSCGAQPMLSADGRFALVFNGEIYNYLELKSALEAQGVAFRTRSDTEVLLALLEREWDGALRRLVGMFAFAVWDSARGELMLARDRTGEKPLYYSVHDGALRFASTFAALHRTRSDRLQLDRAALHDFIALGYIPSPRTIDAGISKLPPGSLLRYRAGVTHVERYWRISTTPESVPARYEDAVDLVRERLSEAVRLRLRSDVPLGIFLSGGIDSSLVAALALRHSDQPLLSFSIAFDERKFDESHIAAAAAAHIGTQHYTLTARFGVLETLPELVRHFGEPFGDPSVLPLWHLAREARRHVTVAVGGDGGDEGFGGYPWYRNADRIARLRRLLGAPARLLPSAALRSLGRRYPPLGRVYRGTRLLKLNDADRYAALRSFMDPDEAARLYAADFPTHAAASATAQRSSSIFQQHAGTALRRMRAVDIETYLADCLLPKTDVATMAHGLEARSPLLDPDLLQLALSLPDEWLVDERGGKRILRDIVGEYYPTGFFNRPKQGFSVPLGSWFSGPLRSRVERLSRSEPLISMCQIRPEGVAALVAEHMSGIRDHGHRLYHLVVLDEWAATT